MGKLCEIIIKERWVAYLERNEIVYERQFGFRSGVSCVSNLLCFYSRVIDIMQERNGWVDYAYLDLKKAFDQVPHTRLLWKLKYEGGLDGTLLTWMEDILRGRKMRTVVRDCVSDWSGAVECRKEQFWHQ